MKKTVWKIYFDFAKEADWLNDMVDKGYALVGYAPLRYTFEECTPGEYIYRIEFLEHDPNSSKSEEYLDSMRQLGIEAVATWDRWVYFRKKAEEGSLELFDDVDSKIEHYQRIGKFMLAIAVAQLGLAIPQFYYLLDYLLEDSKIVLYLTTSIGGLLLFNSVVFFFVWNMMRKKIHRLQRRPIS